MKYAIVETATGRIVQTCTSPSASDVETICSAGQHSLALADGIQDNTHYIVAGVPVAFAPAPTPHHTFDWSSKLWTDPRSFQDLQAAKWADIKASREAAIGAPLATPYGTFDCSLPVQKNITDAVLLLQTLASLGTPATIDFTLANNTTVTLTTAQMVTVGLLMGQRVQIAHITARARRVSIEAATTMGELASITW